MQIDPYEQRLYNLKDRFDRQQVFRQDLEDRLAHRLFRLRGGTDEELMRDRPSQRWLLACEDACLEDARAVESLIEDALDEQKSLLDRDEPLAGYRLSEIECSITELDEELSDANGDLGDERGHV
ncbi:hypothetical protein [Sphingomonas sp. Leaf25]|uniref:hypothetical protein n=1 Tax=Sphingomonas sp. Leaf25 TaxID=1735692 RepID=UPI0006FA4B44|nr:hypothetical protein [Sphingomonas sp. Leaf25]KQM97987.1 hypothetical protein ASE78_06860 [Sphingomonas sp. Leaf25]